MASSTKKSFAEALRLVAIQLASTQGTPLTLLGCSQVTSNPSLILPRLYLGGYWHVINEAQLTALGVTHILSIMEEPPSFNDFKDEKISAKLKTLHVPLQDTFSSNILQHLDQTTEYIHDALSNPESVVLVHCFQGVSRSATVVAAYLLATSDDYDSAASVLQYLKQKRSVVSPNRGFVAQLDKYATICLEKRELKALDDESKEVSNATKLCETERDKD